MKIPILFQAKTSNASVMKACFRLTKEVFHGSRNTGEVSDGRGKLTKEECLSSKRTRGSESKPKRLPPRLLPELRLIGGPEKKPCELLESKKNRQDWRLNVKPKPLPRPREREERQLK